MSPSRPPRGSKVWTGQLVETSKLAFP